MFQQVTLVGNLGRDPELHYSAKGDAVCGFGLAVNQNYGDEERTLWVKVSVWGKQAEACSQYLTKGKQVLVVGTLQFDPQTGGPKLFERKNGEQGTSFEVLAHNIRFLGSARKDGDEKPAMGGSGEAEF